MAFYIYPNGHQLPGIRFNLADALELAVAELANHEHTKVEDEQGNILYEYDYEYDLPKPA